MSALPEEEALSRALAVLREITHTFDFGGQRFALHREQGAPCVPALPLIAIALATDPEGLSPVTPEQVLADVMNRPALRELGLLPVGAAQTVHVPLKNAPRLMRLMADYDLDGGYDSEQNAGNTLAPMMQRCVTAWCRTETWCSDVEALLRKRAGKRPRLSLAQWRGLVDGLYEAKRDGHLDDDLLSRASVALLHLHEPA